MADEYRPPDGYALPGGEGEPWTEKAVRAVLVNPIYTGVPPFPPIVAEEQWIKGMARRIAEEGVEPTLEAMLDELRASMQWAFEESGGEGDSAHRGLWGP
jgi:hypothetical protein